MSTINSTTSPATAVAKSPADVRGFWRILLAVLAPVPMLAKAVEYAFNPVPSGDSPFAQQVAGWGAHQGLYSVLQWFDMAFVVLLVPATFAVAWVARRGAPRLATVGAALALTGFLAGVASAPNDDQLAYTTADKALDLATVTRLDEALQANPTSAVASLTFILGLTIGLLLLGIALWRSRAVPAWMGIALALGGLTHPFMPGNTTSAIGLAVTAVGFSGASVALLRQRNDEFDLPAITRT